MPAVQNVILKNDGSTEIAKVDWQNIISIDASSGTLTIKDYSNVNLVDFDKA